jgi:hypothetical protein
MLKKIKNLNKFKVTSILTSLLYFYLFISLLFFPESLCKELGITENDASLFFVKRASALMLGFSVLVFLVRNAIPSVIRQAISFSVAVNMFGFAISSIFGLIHGTVGTTFLFGAIAEIFLTVVFLTFLISDRRLLKKQSS